MAAIKSCLSCPSYLSEDDSVRQRFGKAIGAPMCGRFGHVLGVPGRPNEEIAQHFALDCKEYKKGLTEKPVTITPRVVQPDVEALSSTTPPVEVGTCNGCKHSVSSADVLQHTGFPLPICKAKGSLIFRPTQESRDCPYSQPYVGGTPVDSSFFEMIPVLKVGFTLDNDVKVKAMMGDHRKVEPTTYESDAPVATEDEAKGIRAWMRFDCPDTSIDYYLPIFRTDFFTEEERRDIPVTGKPFGNLGTPDSYVDHAGLVLAFLKDEYTLNDTLCLSGAAGSGKTQFACHVAWLMQVPLTKFGIKPEMDVEAFIGHPSVDPVRGDYFELGRFPKAVTRPGIVLCDEWNAGPEDVDFTLRHFIDEEEVKIEYKGGQRHQKDDYCFMLLTENPSWDMRNIGTKPTSDAFGSRLSYAWVPEPPEPIMRHILTERCKRDGYEIPPDTLNLIIKIGEDIRALSQDGSFPGTWGLRQEIKVARKTAHYDLKMAYRRAALDAMEPDVVNLVMTAIESHQRPDPAF